MKLFTPNRFLVRNFSLICSLLIVLFFSVGKGWGQVSVTASAGMASATYSTLKGAFDAVNAGTHSGIISLSITASITETASAVLNASGSGSASYTSINISPSGGAWTVSGAITAGSPLIDFNGADNVTIDGLNTGGNSLTISNTTASSTAGTSTLRFIADASNNTITNCSLLGSSTVQGVVFFSTGTSTGNIGNVISNNNIGPAGLNYPIFGISSTGSSSTIVNTETITGNNIYDFFSAASATIGINVSATGNTGWTISNNKIYQTATRIYTSAQTHNGIFIGIGSGYTIAGNTIGFANSNGTGTTNMIGSASAISGFPTSFVTATANATRYIAINCSFTAAGSNSEIKNNTIAGLALHTSSGASSTNGVLCGINVTSGNAIIGGANSSDGNIIGTTTGPVNGTYSVYVSATSVGAVVSPIFATSANTITIQNNKIGDIMTTGTSSSTASGFKGIDVAGTGNFSISDNIIGNDQANNIRSGYFLSASNLSNAATTPTTATGTSAVQGIVSTSTGNVLTITNNTIKGLQISGSVSTHNAIITSGTMTGSTPAVNVNSNSLGNSTLGWINYAVANSGSLTGISVANTIATVHNINSNNFSGITYSVAGTNSNTYINFTGGTAANNISSISSNTFTNLSINTSGSVLFIGHGYSISSTGQLIINNNSIVTAFTRLAAGSITISTSNSTSGTGSINNYTNNNFSNIIVPNNASSTILGFNNTDGGTGSTKTITGNTFNNWHGGTSGTTGTTGSINCMNFSYWNGVSSLSNNTITNITGRSSITGVTLGSTSNAATSIAISGNSINNLMSIGTGGQVLGISCSNTSTSININGNTINNLSSTGSTVTGITISGATANNIFANKIYTLSSSNASGTVTGIVASNGTTNSIYNNIIGDLTAPSSSNANAVIGLNVSGGTNVNASFNSIYLNASSTGATFGTSGIFFSTTPTFSLRNNIVVNISAFAGATNTAVLRRTSGTAATIPSNYTASSNNNLFYAGTPSANNLIYTEGTATTFTNSHQTILGYKTFMSTRDQASISENPTFQSTTGSSSDFLKYDLSTATQIESGGISISGITTDYTGTTVRCPGGGCPGSSATPDIGAWELNGLAADLTGPSITYSPLSNTLCTNAPSLTATITDASGVNSTAGTKPRLYFKKSNDANTFVGNTSADNGWKFVESSSSASPFTFTMDATLLQSALASGDVIQYFVVAQDNAGSPNIGIASGAFASAPSSVALTSAAFALTGTINSFTINPSIPTSVTIGAAGTYTSITGTNGLFAAINAGGLSGNTVATIIDASVTEDGLTALNQITYGCTQNSTLTIKPQTSATLIGSVATGALIKLNGADYVTIDGSNSGGNDKSLTITNTNPATSGNGVIWIASASVTDAATNNTVKNCNVIGNAATTTQFGIYIGGTSSLSTTAASLSTNNNIVISDNIISKIQYGIFQRGVSTSNLTTGFSVTNNSIGTATSGDGYGAFGIFANLLSAGTINGNTIQNNQQSGSLGFAPVGTTTINSALYLQNSVNTTVSRNRIFNINIGGSATIRVWVLSVENPAFNTVGNPSNNLVTNNIVYDVRYTGSGSTTWQLSGINANGGYGDKFYHNSVYLQGNTGSSTSGPNAAFSNGNASTTTITNNIDVRNNIFAIIGSGITLGTYYSHYSRATSSSGHIVNNNNLFINLTGGATTSLGYFNSSNQATFSDWKTNTSFDANGTNVDPLFTSTSDLHINSGNAQTVLESSGANVGVNTDFDGQTRPGPVGSVNGGGTAPDIGADEFDGVPLPQCVTPTIQASSVSITNLSATTLTVSFTAGNGGAYLVVTSTGNTPSNPIDATTYAINSTALGSGTLVVGNGTATTYNLTGLTAGQAYTVYVYSYNNTNCLGGPDYATPASTASFTTCPSTIATAPVSSVASNIGNYGFTAVWQSVSGWTPSNYVLDVSTNSSFTSFVTGYSSLNVGNVTSFNVTGLASGTSYFYRVRATDGSCVTPNSLTQNPTTENITSAGTGDWNSGTSWSGGQVPLCTDNVTILSGHTITVNSSSNVTRNLTIPLGASVVIASGDLTVGCTDNNALLFIDGGTLNVSGGALNVNGKFAVGGNTSSVFIQSGGAIVVDGNSGTLATSINGHIVDMYCHTTSTLQLTGGTFTVLDPTLSTTSTNCSFKVYPSVTHSSGPNWSLVIGNGVSNNPGGHSGGFLINLTNTLSFAIGGTVTLNSPWAANRHVTTSNAIPLNNLTVTKGDWRTTSINYISGNLVNNDTLTNPTSGNLVLSSFSGSSASASNNAQTISGTGFFRNTTTNASKTADLSGLTINNSNATGVTLSVPLSISGTLTLTSGKVLTSNSSILRLGTSTTAGTLSGTATATNMIIGPFSRTFPASRTATGTYNNSTLFPIGQGTDYPQLYIDPTTTSGGPVIITANYSTTNTGSAGTGVNTLSNSNWSISITSGASNLTSSNIRVFQSSITTSNKLLFTNTSTGQFSVISGGSVSAGTSPNISLTSLSPLTTFPAFLAFGDLIACTTPVDQASSLSSASNTSSGYTLTIAPAASNPTGYLVVRYTGTITPTTPVDGTNYTAGQSALGGTVVGNYLNSPFTFNETGLTASTQYTYYVYSFNNNSGCSGPAYNISSPLITSFTTCGTTNTPTAISASSIINNGFVLNYTPSSTGAVISHELDISVSSTFASFVTGYNALSINVPGNGTPSATTYNVTGLSSSTSYFIRMRAVNTGGCYSTYTSNVSVTTLCDPISSFPSTEPFDTYLPTICWQEGDLGNLSTGPATIGGSSTSDWVEDGFLNSGTVGCAKMNIDAATGSEWILSPLYSIPSSGYRVKYSVGATQWNNTIAPSTAWEADDFVELLISTSNTNWTILKTYNSSNVPSHLGQIDNVDLSLYNGQTVRFAFRAFEGASNGSADIDFFIDNFSVELTPTFTWAGTTSVDPAISGNWSTGTLPTSNSNIIIPSNVPNYPTYTTLTIAQGNTFTLQSNAQLTISGTLTNNGNLTLESGATIVQGSGSTLAGSGTYNVKQAITGDGTTTPSGRFWYLGSPVSLASSSVYFASNAANVVKKRSESTNAWTALSSGTPENLVVGQGYYTQAIPANSTINFTGGLLNNGAISITNLTRTAGQGFEGFNLVCNPYPSYLNWDDVSRTNVDGTMWYRTHDGTNMVFETYVAGAAGGVGTNLSGNTATKYIPPMQSYWVRVTQGQTSGSLALDNTMRSHFASLGGSTAGLRSTQDDPSLFLRMNLLQANKKDQLIVYVNEQATNGFDILDGEKMMQAGFPQFYTKAGDKKIVINGLNSAKKQQALPVTIELPTTGVHSFVIEDLEISNGLVWLEDKQEEIIQALEPGTVYEFYANSGINSERFVLHFQLIDDAVPTNVYNEVNSSANFSGKGANVYAESAGVVVIKLPASAEGVTDIQIRDAAGKLVYAGSMNNLETSVELAQANGIYYVTLSSNTGVEVRKVFIQQ